MDINNMKDDAKKFADSEIGKQVIGGAEHLAHEKIAEVRKMADTKGLGDMLDGVINMAEQKTGMDIDGDGDTGK